MENKLTNTGKNTTKLYTENIYLLYITNKCIGCYFGGSLTLLIIPLEVTSLITEKDKQ